MPADTAPLVPRRPAPPQKSAFRKALGRPFKHFTHYGALTVLSIILACYIITMTFSPIGTIGHGAPGTKYNYGGFRTPKGYMDIPWSTGYIIDPGSEQNTIDGLVAWKGAIRPIVANSIPQMIALGISRGSAFFIYPCLVLVFTTKFRATMEMIAQSPFGMFTYNDLHELHVHCGWVCVIDGTIHTALHTLRWILQGNINLLGQTKSGVSGIIALLCMWIIGLPMYWEVLRGRIAYETRKYLHYFFVVFCVAMSFHAPFSTIPNGGFAPIIFPTLILWWVLDSFYVYFFMTERINTSTFHVLPTGVQLTMTVSERFQKNAADGGYCYINLPWISKHQWHAYSLFENPANPAERQVFMMKLGDWTTDVLQALQRDTRRPCWVCGPFSSPYDNAAEMDNQILVAGGIGITPALSVMRKHQDTRRPNLIWACRDPHMLEFFCTHGEFSRRGWNMIFYTGKAALYIGDSSEIITANGAIVHIVRARPNLGDLIPNIIYSIESGEYVPEDFISEVKADAITQMQEKLEELDELNLTSQQKMSELMNFSNDLGFLFTDLMGEVAKESGDVISSAVGAGEEKKEENRAQMLQNIQMYKSTRKSAFAPKKGRATQAWGAIESGMDSWLDDFHANAYKPWENDSSESREYVNSLDRKEVLGTWGSLYCGGQGPLAINLKKACKQFGVSLAMESFKW